MSLNTAEITVTIKLKHKTYRNDTDEIMDEFEECLKDWIGKEIEIEDMTVTHVEPGNKYDGYSE